MFEKKCVVLQRTDKELIFAESKSESLDKTEALPRDDNKLKSKSQ